MFNLYADPSKDTLRGDILRGDLPSFTRHVSRMLTLGELAQKDIPELRKWIRRNKKLQDVLIAWEDMLQRASRSIHETLMRHQQVCISRSNVYLYYSAVLGTV